MQLFYNENINTSTKEVVFNKDESRHIVRVLRKKEGDVLHITNGKGFLFFTKITFANDKKCISTVINYEEKSKEWNYNLHIAIAPTKNITRLEWFLEKATEIGIDEITLIICQNSERKVVKTERLEKIILSAMKQSLKFTKPKLNEPVNFSDFLNKTSNENIFIAHCEKAEKKSLKSINLNDSYTILIGPEGDFSKDEINLANSKNIVPITLGKSRLRTETAGLVAVQNVYFLNSD
ncbi:MAG: 16S rRNA (uracil(1498)-N(3))-methyltransferase [Tenacibaculum sp.]|nr:16S rRNA (uracil(1498)-N(3))-methyltransferase [Tenacibaculum sp.]